MVIAKAIDEGGLFPKVDPSAELTLDDLSACEQWTTNHPSFGLKYGGSEPPGIALLRGYVDAGLGSLYPTVAEAEAAFGAKLHPAPWGT